MIFFGALDLLQCVLHVDKNEAHILLQPGVLTSYVQAGIMRIYKTLRRTNAVILQMDGKLQGSTITARGNSRQPSVEVLAGWIKTALRNVPQDVIDIGVFKTRF